MAENDSLKFALESYAAAIAYYKAGHFAKAHKKMREYQRLVEYATFQTVDTRGEDPGHAAVIIVTRDRGDDLIACLASLKNQQESPFETIVVDNGGRQPLRDVLSSEKLLLVECPAPFTPSEARNIGAFHARAELLIFLDDDGLAEPGFVQSAVHAFAEHPFLGIRGRILPKSADADQSLAGLYDLGAYPIPALLDIEGNIAVPKPLYRAAGGMNPLLFGAEGLDLTARLLEANPAGEVYYWPKMVIRHDYADGDRLVAKRERQALVNEYFRVMNPRVLKIKAHYTGVHRAARKQAPGFSPGRITAKITTVARDMGLALKGEKNLTSRKATPDPETEGFSHSGDFAFRPFTDSETAALLKNVQVLETELEITRKSIAFRMGHLIREALASPSRQGLLLPVRLARLVKEYWTRPENFDFGAVQKPRVIGRGLRNRMVYTQPGRQEHRFALFDEFRPHRQTRNSSLRIACIAAPWMQACLAPEANVEPLRVDTWQTALHANRPDFVLVQSLLEKTDHWPEKCAAIDDSPAQLANMIAFCQGQGIPTVFWDTEDHVHFPLFRNIAPLFDQVFAADPRSVEAYSRLLKKNAVALSPAVQPVLHNPFTSEDDNYSGFTFILDGWADLLEYPAESDALRPLLREGLHIVESRYRLMANKLEDLPGFEENIMGCISDGQRLSALRHYKVQLMLAKTLSTPLARSWRALEALACGCSVVMSGAISSAIPDGLVVRAANDPAMRDKAVELLKDETGRQKQLHLARRTLYGAHTYAHRIGTICHTLGIRHDWAPCPLASIVLPTKRPELIAACVEKFHRQNYPNKELIIVVNTDAADMDKIRVASGESADVRVTQLHQEKNIGVCLNFGIDQARGKYWFKMDDDDFYGPNYLLDMVQLAETADFHIMGKPTAFVYLESEDKVYLRNKARNVAFTIGSPHTLHLCGATLAGRRDRFPGFSESHRACVDTDFVESGKASNRALLCADIWNFVAFRAADKGKHTWRHDDEGIKKNAVLFCEGLQLEKVMI
jgi:glycosyltransferase involved in cell wall biosynthesis